MKASLVSLLLALAVSLTQGQRFRTDGCPEPYDRFDETRCILTDPFVNRNYATALAFCKAHGGKLVHFDNCFDQILLYDYLHTEVGLAEHSYWLGATDEAEEGVWIWEHNKQPVPMGNPFWENGEPSITTNFNCGYLHTSFSHRWFDAKCDGGAKTICFRDA